MMRRNKISIIGQKGRKTFLVQMSKKKKKNKKNKRIEILSNQNNNKNL
jgi:hypothetical protein